LAGGQGDSEAGSARLRIDFDASFVAKHDVLADPQTQTQSELDPPLAGGEMHVEDPIQVIGVDTRTGVD
jgi:hypothetical protein